MVGIQTGVKGKRVLAACREPKRFTELLRETGLSKAWLAELLKNLVEEGLLEKLPDGRYVLTEEGKEVLEKFAVSLEAEELLQESLERGYAAAVKKELEGVLKPVFAVEAVIRVLRAWAMATALWRWLSAGRVRADAEEKRAVAMLETVLRQLGGEEWWKRFAIFLPSWIVERMNELYKEGKNPLLALAAPVERTPREVKELLKDIPPRGIEALTEFFGEEIQYHLQLLAHLAKERAAEVAKLSTKEKLGKAAVAVLPILATGMSEFHEKELEYYLS